MKTYKLLATLFLGVTFIAKAMEVPFIFIGNGTDPINLVVPDLLTINDDGDWEGVIEYVEGVTTNSDLYSMAGEILGFPVENLSITYNTDLFNEAVGRMATFSLDIENNEELAYFPNLEEGGFDIILHDLQIENHHPADGSEEVEWLTESETDNENDLRYY